MLLRLYFAFTKQLASWLIGVFTVMEMAVVMGTIWLYHLQFEHPAIVVLKNSGFLYVFVLIALRGLRFDPLWVILSGFTAAIGWALLVGFALHISGGMPLTWDYITYATTGKIHLGAEFDKILTILLATGILALSLNRSRHLLAQSATQTQAASDLSLFFDSDVAERITHTDMALAAGQGMQRNAAILFTDMRGFTAATAHLAPTDVVAMLSDYQRRIVPIIRKYGGSIDKFMGDGILASFGAVNPSSTYAADGMKAIDAILQAAAAWRQENPRALDIGAGLAVGDVVFGTIGDGTRLEYTVIGDAVNLAAKLEKHNKIERTRALTTQETLSIALAQGYLTTSPEIRSQRNIGGIATPLDLVVWP